MKNSDVDALCISYKFVERSDFEHKFIKCLTTKFQNVKNIPTATVPLIEASFVSSNKEVIEFDILFTRLTSSSIPTIVQVKEILHMNPKCAMSLNGARSCEAINDYTRNSVEIKKFSWNGIEK